MGHWKKLKNNLDTSENRNISKYTGFNENNFKEEIWRNTCLSQERIKKKQSSFLSKRTRKKVQSPKSIGDNNKYQNRNKWNSD